MFKLVGKTVYVILLLVMFVYLVGYDSVRKYLDEETFFSEKKVANDASKPPAVSVMVHNVEGLGGWKPRTQDSEYFRFIEKFCNGYEDFSTVIQCIENKTYSAKEAFLSIKNGKKNDDRLEIR